MTQSVKMPDYNGTINNLVVNGTLGCTGAFNCGGAFTAPGFLKSGNYASAVLATNFNIVGSGPITFQNADVTVGSNITYSAATSLFTLVVAGTYLLIGNVVVNAFGGGGTTDYIESNWQTAANAVIGPTSLLFATNTTTTNQTSTPLAIAIYTATAGATIKFMCPFTTTQAAIRGGLGQTYAYIVQIA